MELLTDHRVQVAPRTRVWAWALVVFTPIALGVALFAFVTLLEALSAVTWPAGQFGAAFDPWGLTVSLLGASIVGLAAPSVALILASRARREGDLRAKSAVTASVVALVVVAVLVSPLGALLWGPVLYTNLRRDRATGEQGASRGPGG